MSVLGWAITAMAAGAAGAAALPFWAERRRGDVRQRPGAPGAFADLPMGRTHYRWIGAETGEVLLCVHGLTTPSYVWDGLAPALAAAGQRMLVYDLYGRGYSDRPRGAQDAGFFHRQIDALLAHEGVEGPVNLVGYSMGGAIAASYAAAQPGRVRRLALLAPAGMQHEMGPVLRLVRDLPGLGDWLMLARYPALHRRGTEAERALPSAVPGIVDRQQDELRWRGFTPAVLSSLRHMLRAGGAADHAALRAAGLPVLAIWGLEDAVIPPGAARVLADWNPEAQQHMVEGAGHGLPYTHAAEVGPRLAAFFRGG